MLSVVLAIATLQVPQTSLPQSPAPDVNAPKSIPVTALVSPLALEERRLLASPSEVKYTVVKSAFRRFGLTLRQFARIPAPEQDNLVREAYYLLALERAILLHRGDAKLVDIVNKFDGTNQQSVMTEFDSVHHTLFGEYSDVVPVDSKSILARLLSDMKLR